MTGGLQDVFITGAALAVDCQKDIGFFPDIYNEDWLFFYDDASHGLLGSSGHKITQLRYDPFADPKRAAWQEFGDVLAEGLYALLEHGMGRSTRPASYWIDFLAPGKAFSRAILRRAETANPAIREQLLLSVEAALKCSVTIEPESLERYIWLWRQDLRDWQRRVAAIRQTLSLEVALKELGLESQSTAVGADVARPASGGSPEEPPTMPFTLQRPLRPPRSATGPGRPRGIGPGKTVAGVTRRASILHHGSPGVREGGRLASAWRAFRIPGREYAPAESSPAPDAGQRSPCVAVCS